jgi:hypothetical protein
MCRGEGAEDEAAKTYLSTALGFALAAIRACTTAGWPCTAWASGVLPSLSQIMRTGLAFERGMEREGRVREGRGQRA